MTNRSKRIYIAYAIIFVIMISLIGIAATYAYLNVTAANSFGTQNINASAECLNISYSESSTINLTKQYPVSDSIGQSSTPVAVTIKNECTTGADLPYTLTLTSLYKTADANYIPDSKMKIYVADNLTTRMLSTVTKITSGNIYTYLNNDFKSRTTVKDYTIRTHYQIATGSLAPTKSKTYNFRLWIDYNEGGANNSTQGKPFAAAISVVVG